MLRTSRMTMAVFVPWFWTQKNVSQSVTNFVFSVKSAGKGLDVSLFCATGLFLLSPPDFLSLSCITSQLTLGQPSPLEHPACFSVWEQPWHASAVMIIIYSWGCCIPSSFNVTVCRSINTPRKKGNMFNYFTALFYNIYRVSPGAENIPTKTQIKINPVIIKTRTNPKYAFGLWLNRFGGNIIAFFIFICFFYAIF